MKSQSGSLSWSLFSASHAALRLRSMMSILVGAIGPAKRLSRRQAEASKRCTSAILRFNTASPVSTRVASIAEVGTDHPAVTTALIERQPFDAKQDAQLRVDLVGNARRRARTLVQLIF